MTKIISFKKYKTLIYLVLYWLFVSIASTAIIMSCGAKLSFATIAYTSLLSLLLVFILSAQTLIGKIK